MQLNGIYLWRLFQFEDFHSHKHHLAEDVRLLRLVTPEGNCGRDHQPNHIPFTKIAIIWWCTYVYTCTVWPRNERSRAWIKFAGVYLNYVNPQKKIFETCSRQAANAHCFILTFLYTKMEPNAHHAVILVMKNPPFGWMNSQPSISICLCSWGIRSYVWGHCFGILLGEDFQDW